MIKPYLALTDDDQYYTCPVDMDTMKCCIWKGQYCSLLVGLYLVKGSADCAIP